MILSSKSRFVCCALSRRFHGNFVPCSKRVLEQLKENLYDTKLTFMEKGHVASHLTNCNSSLLVVQAGQEKISVDFSLKPVRNKSGKIVYLLAEGRNITGTKQHIKISGSSML